LKRRLRGPNSSTHEQFRNALEGVFAEAERLAVSFVTIRAIDFYRRAGGDPGDDARMAVRLEAMKASVTSDDVVLNEPTAGESAALTIEYRLSRPGAVRGG
jgi:hypothetical protein